MLASRGKFACPHAEPVYILLLLGIRKLSRDVFQVPYRPSQLEQRAVEADLVKDGLPERLDIIAERTPRLDTSKFFEFLDAITNQGLQIIGRTREKARNARGLRRLFNLCGRGFRACL